MKVVLALQWLASPFIISPKVEGCTDHSYGDTPLECLRGRSCIGDRIFLSEPSVLHDYLTDGRNNKNSKEDTEDIAHNMHHHNRE